MTIASYEFNGLSLPIRVGDGYINATALSQNYAVQSGKTKQPSDWLRLKRTQETLKYISSVTGLPEEALVQVVQGGDSVVGQGTFLHSDLAVPFASWLSVEFEHKVTKIVQLYITKAASSQTAQQIDSLWQIVNVMYVYLQGIQGFNKTIHTGIHNQSDQINPALKQIEEMIKQYRS